MARKKSKQACVLCGADPARGFATIDGKRYCHGDWDPDPTCYMLGQRAIAKDRTVELIPHPDDWFPGP